MMPPDKFYTVHKPKEHSAHRLDNSVLVKPQPTEIQLVAELGKLGISVGDYDYSESAGGENMLVVNWERASWPT